MSSEFEKVTKKNAWNSKLFLWHLGKCVFLIISSPPTETTILLGDKNVLSAIRETTSMTRVRFAFERGVREGEAYNGLIVIAMIQNSSIIAAK